MARGGREARALGSRQPSAGQLAPGPRDETRSLEPDPLFEEKVDRWP